MNDTESVCEREKRGKNDILHVNADGVMARKKKSGKLKRNVLITLLIIGIVIIVVVAALYQSQLSQSKPTAEQYFKISDVTYEGFLEDDGSLLILHILTFNVTAVEGDAHQVRIPNLGPDEPSVWREEYIDLGTMLQGEVETVTLSTEKGVYIHLKEEGFPVGIRIISEEISKDPKDQFITVYVTQEEQVNK